MTKHDPRHEDWLVTRLAGEPLGEEVVRALESCCECRASLSDLAAVEAAIERAAAHEQAVVARMHRAEATAIQSPAESRVQPHSPSHGRGGTLKIAAALAVTAILGFVGYRLRDRGDEPTIGPPLGAGAIENPTPRGRVASFFRFEFRATLPPGGSFRIRVYDPAAAGKHLLESPLLKEPRWIPSQDERRKIPNAFRYEVRVLDASGERLDAASFEVVVDPN